MPSPSTFDLSPREITVLWFYGAEGLPIKQVAYHLGISEETAKSYLKRIRTKLRSRDEPVAADSRVDLFRAALSECVEMPACLAARGELLRYLLDEDAPERMLVAA